jgi:hypothetical protein
MNELETKTEGITENGILEEQIKDLMTDKAIKDLGDLNPTMQQFILRFVDVRDLIIVDKMDKHLDVKLKAVSDKISDDVSKIIDRQNQMMLNFFNTFGGIVNGVAADVREIRDATKSTDRKMKYLSRKILTIEKRLEDHIKETT